MVKDNNKMLKINLARFCAYRDRCKSEVFLRLSGLGVEAEAADELVQWLIDEKYLDETRFAIAFARGRFSINKWGKVAIANALKHKGIGQPLIDQALNSIPEQEYLAMIEKLAAKKWSSTPHSNVLVRCQKTFNSLASKGYESHLIKDELRKYQQQNSNLR